MYHLISLSNYNYFLTAMYTAFPVQHPSIEAQLVFASTHCFELLRQRQIHHNSNGPTQKVPGISSSSPGWRA